MMRSFCILVFGLFCALGASAQWHKFTAGAGAGGSFYLGDLNPNRMFDEPHMMGSLFGAYEWNEHISTRVQLSMGKISGTSNVVSDVPNAQSFSKTFGMVDVRNEFNFMPFNALYETLNKNERFTPYFHVGMGMGFLPVNFFEIPLGIGLKYKLNDRISLGFEWTFHKTFSDKIDGNAPYSDQSAMINNDWISYAMFSIRVPLSNNCNCHPQK